MTNWNNNDDKNNRGPKDRSKISLTEPYEVEYWSKHFGITPNILRDIVSKVGHNVTDVEKYIQKNK